MVGMKPRALLATCSLLLVVTGCGDPPIATEDYPAAYTKAYCERAVRCGLASDEPSCAVGASVELGQAVASVAAGRATFDSDVARACLDGLASPGCDFEPGPACGHEFAGLREDAEACFVNGDCRSGNCAQVSCDSACCEGVCTARSGVGASCQSSAECAEGLECKVGEVTASCQPLPGPGEHCDFQGECPSGYYCSLDFSPTDAPLGGTCERAGGHDEPCEAFFPYDSCVERDQYCERSTDRCTTRVGPGDICMFLTSGLRPAGSTCQLDATCTMNRCVLWPVGEGTPCTEQCGYGYECTSAGVCRATPAPQVCR
jgi:hypothetical protein